MRLNAEVWKTMRIIPLQFYLLSKSSRCRTAHGLEVVLVVCRSVLGDPSELGFTETLKQEHGWGPPGDGALIMTNKHKAPPDRKC